LLLVFYINQPSNKRTAVFAYHSNTVYTFSKIPDLLGAKERGFLVLLVTIDDGLALVLTDGSLADLEKTSIQLGCELIKGGSMKVGCYRMLKRFIWITLEYR